MQWLGVARGGSFVAFLSGECLCVFSTFADNIHDSRVDWSEVVSCTNYDLHTADFAAIGILLLQTRDPH